MRQAGYATDRKYPQKLIALIERYDLHKYDEEVVENGLSTVRDTKQYEVFTHEVKKGDTLYGISKRYDISVEELRRLNNLNGNIISIGQILNILRAQ